MQNTVSQPISGHRRPSCVECWIFTENTYAIRSAGLQAKRLLANMRVVCIHVCVCELTVGAAGNETRRWWFYVMRNFETRASDQESTVNVNRASAAVRNVRVYIRSCRL